MGVDITEHTLLVRPLVMFVLIDSIASLGHMVALFLLYKETESVILIDEIIFLKAQKVHSLSLLAFTSLHAFRHC